MPVEIAEHGATGNALGTGSLVPLNGKKLFTEDEFSNSLSSMSVGVILASKRPDMRWSHKEEVMSL